jgi:hypothetical protein
MKRCCRKFSLSARSPAEANNDREESGGSKASFRCAAARN